MNCNIIKWYRIPLKDVENVMGMYRTDKANVKTGLAVLLV